MAKGSSTAFRFQNDVRFSGQQNVNDNNTLNNKRLCLDNVGFIKLYQDEYVWVRWFVRSKNIRDEVQKRVLIIDRF